MIGLIYETGRGGVPKDKSKAIFYYETAINTGNPDEASTWLNWDLHVQKPKLVPDVYLRLGTFLSCAPDFVLANYPLDPKLKGSRVFFFCCLFLSLIQMLVMLCFKTNLHSLGMDYADRVVKAGWCTSPSFEFYLGNPVIFLYPRVDLIPLRHALL